MDNPLLNILNQLGLIEHNAVFFRKKEDGQIYNAFTSEIKKKIEIIKPTAFFVFNKQPFVLFFDLTNNSDSKREKEIYKQVWSFNHSPVIFIIKNTEIQVFNAFSYNKKNGGSLEEIKISVEERNDKFSFWNLQSGATWKWLQQDYYENSRKRNSQKRVNQRLFENIKEVREALTSPQNHNKLSDDEANTLILRLIFVRYLIDRNVKIDDNYISGKTTKERRHSFSDLMADFSLLQELFKKLNGSFNGVLFKDINISLSTEQATSLAKVFKGEKPEEGSLFAGTDFYFEIFDFSIIPVEVISGIYESLIDVETRKLHSAVYTPSFLVEYILTDTVDKYLDEHQVSECKIFDPSVGSGIFLVQSLRKMIDKELELNKHRGLKLDEKQFSKRIRKIATNNLFGIDINPEALKVTCFSIYIALLDYQKPKDIDSYKFPDLLGENLFEANFFNTEHPFNKKIKSINLNFILGNPPWKNGSKDKHHVEYLKENNLLNVVGNYQLAQSFTIRTKDFSNEKTKCGLVVTSKAIYNITAAGFKKYFLEKFFLTKCFDLSAVNNLIFEGAGNPAMIILFNFSNGKNTLENNVNHISLKHNIYLKYYQALVIEKNDIKIIKQDLFLKDKSMFKIALYGGTLDYQFLKELDLTQFTIKDHINSVEGLHFGDGIKLLTQYGRKKLKKDPQPFEEIRKTPIIETSAISQFYTIVDEKNIPKEKDLFVKSGDNINLYRGKKILLKARPKNNTQIVFSYISKDCVFREKTLGISTLDKINDLNMLYGIIASNLFGYYQFLTSSSLGIFMPEIMQKEYLSFPFKNISINDNKKMITTVSEFIRDIEKSYSSLIKEDISSSEKTFKEIINEIIQNTYSIKPYQLDLIDYVLHISRYQFKENKINEISNFTYLDKSHYRNIDLVLMRYAEIYITEFEKIYQDEYLQVEIYPLGYFIAMNFVLRKDRPEKTKRIVFPKDKLNEEEVLRILANNLSISQITNTNDPSKNLFIQKDIKGFEKNSFYIIKPNEYKSWHRAMAWYDVAEFMEVIEQDELDYLKENPDAW